jgi:hypothetical protein
VNESAASAAKSARAACSQLGRIKHSDVDIADGLMRKWDYSEIRVSERIEA